MPWLAASPQFYLPLLRPGNAILRRHTVTLDNSRRVKKPLPGHVSRRFEVILLARSMHTDPRIPHTPHTSPTPPTDSRAFSHGPLNKPPETQG